MRQILLRKNVATLYQAKGVPLRCWRCGRTLHVGEKVIHNSHANKLYCLDCEEKMQY